MDGSMRVFAVAIAVAMAVRVTARTPGLRVDRVLVEVLVEVVVIGLRQGQVDVLALGHAGECARPQVGLEHRCARASARARALP